jgi:enamidase
MLRIIATTCVIGLLASPTAMAGQADIILVGAKVLTGDSNQPAAEAVALAGERIRAVGPSAEIRRLAGPRTRVVDLRGRTLIAGLIDAHVHLLGLPPDVVDEPSQRNYERTTLLKVMAGFISHGITTVRSTGDPLPYIAQLRDRLERGQLVGPRLLITGPIPSSPGGFPVSMCRDNPFCRQMGFRVIESEEQARQVVRELARAKVDAIKVVVDDVYGKVPALSDAVISALVDETHRTGLRVIVHVSVAKDAIARRLIEWGVDEFVHLFVSDRRGTHFALAPINDLSPPNPAEVSQIAGLLVARNIPVTTTVSNGDAYRDTTGVERLLVGGSPPYTPAMRQRLEWSLNTVRGFADAGVKLVLGTDDVGPPPSNSVVRDDPRLQPGARTLHEMELLHRAGLPTPAILTAATRNAAEALRIIDKVGTIAEGKLADLVILDGDFLQDFSTLHRTVAVLKGGRVVHGALPER